MTVEAGTVTSVTVANVSFPFIYGDLHAKFLPLEALSLTSALEAEGYHVDFRDYQQSAVAYSDPQSPTNAASFFADANEVIIITTPHDAMPVAILWAEGLKALEPNHIIILGGYGPRHVAAPIVEHLPSIDVVIHGTLELTGPCLVSHLNRDLAQVPGIAYRDRSGVHVTKPPLPLTTLDQLPLPAYHKVNLDSYWEIMVFSARGCPFHCSFCVRSGKLVEKSIDTVVREISTLRDVYGQKRVFFYDQTFTLKKKRVVELCRRLREEGLSDVEWSCTGRLNIADVQLMDEMADSGCKMIYFGVESGSDEVLKRIDKHVTRAMAEEVISEAQHFFSVNAFFVWGFPFESMDDFRATIEMILQLSDQGVAPIIYVLSALPSSRIYREYRDQLKFHREVWDADWPVHLSNPASREQVARLIESHPSVFPGFYSCDPRILEKLHIMRELGLETHFPDV